MEVIEENPVSLSHVKKFLTDNSKKSELNFRAAKTLDYATQFKTKSISDIEELRTKIEELNIPRLKLNHIYKLIDILPKDQNDVKVVLQSSGLALSTENYKKISDTLNA